MVIMGQSIFRRHDGQEVLSVVKSMESLTPLFQDDWNGFNVLQMVCIFFIFSNHTVVLNVFTRRLVQELLVWT